MTSERYDYVIVGAGSSGCALAARLSENGRYSVAVLEAGKEQRPRTTAIPAALVRTIGDERYDWRYTSQPDPTRNGRREPWPRGRGPGGSGLINGMIFVRGAPADYDAWRELGATGWGYDDVLPNFRRMESVSGIGGALRGQSGPQSVSALRYVHPVTRLFVESAQAAGIPFTADYNGAQQDGVGFVQAAQRGGRRHSPHDAFLQPAVAARRVRLIQEARVQRVVFNGRVAQGVTYLAPDNSSHLVEANRMVVLSAGAINTPQLLMLSGVGPASDLMTLGIRPVVDAPQVGANLMEHAGAWMRARLDVPTLNSHATPAGKALALVRWLAGGGPATTTTAQSVAFVRTQAGLDAPDIQIHFAAFGFTGPAQTDPGQRLVMIVPSVNHPESRGAIKLASKDPQDAPLILPRLLESERDMATLRRGVRLCRAILEAGPMRRHLVELLESPPEADDALDGFIRAAAGPLYHPVGTCRMGSDEGSVVRPDLTVRGVDRLAVVDVSIMPRHISGNTHAAALMIGDKAADLLRKHPMNDDHAALLARTGQSWIDGKAWAGSGRSIPHVNPSNGEVLGDSQCLEEEGVEAALASARRAFRGEWGRQATDRRIAQLLAFADAIARNVDALALLESLEVGRPVADARALVAMAPEFIRRYARMAEVGQGDVTAAHNRLLTFSWRRPRGVVVAIVPWNFPVMNAIVRIAPALAAGNAVVLKPSENAPRATRLLASIASDAGLPDGVFNVVLGDGATTGRLLASHDDVDLVSFTGSTASGLAVSRAAATSRAKPVILECGGKSPQIMLDDAFDDPAAWHAIFFSSFWNSGQWCAARTRLLVPRSRLNAAIDGLSQAAAAWTLGDPLQASTRLGPLVNASQRERVLEYFHVAGQQGRLQELGCPAADLHPAGQFVRPAVVIEPSRGSRITREEVFGPLLTVETFADTTDAIALANATDYGLMASVWTKRSAEAYRFARELQVGCVSVYSSAEAAMSSLQDFVTSTLEPQKRSGHGADGGMQGLHAYTTVQSISLFN